MSRSDRGTRREHLQRKQRKKPTPLWVQNSLHYGKLAAVALAIFAVPYWMFSSGWVSQQGARLSHAWLTHTAEAGLTADNIFVTGREETNASDVVQALNLDKGTPLLSFDPALAHDRLTNLPWVKEARVERRFPNTVVVGLTERQPIGFFQQNGTLSLVDADGVVLAKDGLGRWAGLPVLVGAEAPQRAPELLSLLEDHPEIAPRVKALTLVNLRRWNLRLQNNIDVLLPENDLAGALERLESAQKDSRILEKDIASIDLRLPDRMIIAPTPAGNARITNPKQAL